MTRHGCAAVQGDLEAFVDGELTGAERLVVSRHLDRCQACAGEVGALRALGETLRSKAGGGDGHAPDLAGLAAGVISRSRAEADLSWRAWLERASEDWHWVIVGAGSLAATLVSALLLSALLAFGPEPQRRDSLAGFYSPDDVVLAYATPMPLEQDIMLLSAEYGPSLTHTGSEWTSAAYWPGVEAHLVKELVWSVTRGNATSADDGDPTDRLIQEALLEEITRLRLAEPMLVGRPTSTQVAVSSVISWRSSRGLMP